RTVRHADRGRAVVNRGFFPCLGDEEGVICQADDRTKLDHLFDGVVRWSASQFVDDSKYAGERLPDGFAAYPICQTLRLLVEEGHPAMGIRDDHAVADAGECRGE